MLVLFQLYIIFTCIFSFVFMTIKYACLSDNEYLYEYLFGKGSTLTFICTMIPLIPEAITFPIWMTKIIFNGTTSKWREYKGLPPKEKSKREERKND